jgi:hypothetical protein
MLWTCPLLIAYNESFSKVLLPTLQSPKNYSFFLSIRALPKDQHLFNHYANSKNNDDNGCRMTSILVTDTGIMMQTHGQKRTTLPTQLARLKQAFVQGAIFIRNDQEIFCFYKTQTFSS